MVNKQLEQWTLDRLGTREYCNIFDTLCRDSVNYFTLECKRCYETRKK